MYLLFLKTSANIEFKNAIMIHAIQPNNVFNTIQLEKIPFCQSTCVRNFKIRFQFAKIQNDGLNIFV